MLRFLYLLCLIGSVWLRMLPPAHALQGDGKCGFFLCVNATVHNDMVTYEMTGLQEPVGWLALGFGTQMNHTHMVIMWPNDDGTTTLSQRMAFGHVEPLPVEYPPRRAKIVEPRFSTAWHSKAVKTLAFTIPVNTTIMSASNPTERLIWAYGKVRPEKAHYSMLTQHYMAGSLTMNLGRTLPETQVTSRPVSSSTGISSKLVRDRLIVVHGLFGSIGFLVLLPSGVLFARWGRTLMSKWIGVHKIIMLIAFPVISLGWILGPVLVSNRDPNAPHFSSAHHITGIVLVALYYIQVFLGRHIHHLKQLAASPRIHPPLNILHVTLGLTIITIAFVQVRSGMEEWKMSSGDTHIAHWCHVLWNAWALMFLLAYLIGLLLLQRQFFQERNGVVPGGGKYFALSSNAGAHHIFQISDESDEVLDKSLSGRTAAELVRQEPGSIPLLSDRRT